MDRWSSTSALHRLVSIPELPSSSNDFDWPSAQGIVRKQANHQDNRPNNLNLVNEIWITSSGVTWIPGDSSKIQLRLCIIAHTGHIKHCGWTSTENSLQESYYCTCNTASEQTYNSVIAWFVGFGTSNQLMSDGTTHFKNETIRMLTISVKVPDHFTLPYTPWPMVSWNSLERSSYVLFVHLYRN